MKIAEYIAWQTALTAHQHNTHLASAKNLQASCKFISRDSQPLGREDSAWTQNFSENIIFSELSISQKLQLTKSALFKKTNFHVVSSPFENLWQISIILLLIFSRSKFAVIMEPYNDTKHDYFNNKQFIGLFKKLIRPLLYKFVYYHLLNQAVRIYAISPKCVRQMLDIGIKRPKVSAFGYFIPTIEMPKNDTKPMNQLTIAYVGGGQTRKGLDDLLGVWQKCAAKNDKLKLDIYGVPKRQTNLNVRFQGMIPFGQVPQNLVGYDAVIIPSRFDGWSLVVNEAISAGTFIIVRKAVGASIIVNNCSVGLTYEDESELERLLINTGNLIRRIRGIPRENFSRAKNLLTPENAGLYFANELMDVGARSNLKKILTDDSL